MGRCFLYRSNVSVAEKGEIIVTAEVGAIVTCSNGETTKTETATNGTCIFPKLSEGTWTVSTEINGDVVTETIVMDSPMRVFVVLADYIPAFTYTGDFAIVADDDSSITHSRDNWKIRFLSSGTLTFQNLKGAANGIDVFMVGGGGGGAFGGTFNGGGGGGYTTTLLNVPVAVGNQYEIVVGDGGEPETAGKATSAFGSTAKGGSASYSSNSYYGGHGGNGGSGGGGGMMGGSEQLYGDGHGGSDGGDGNTVQHYEGNINGGKGQGTTTREFGESTGKLYAGGGGGGSWMNKGGAGGEGGGGDGSSYPGTPKNGEPNTGGGGGGTRNGTGASGGSGIVIIRNKR